MVALIIFYPIHLDFERRRSKDCVWFSLTVFRCVCACEREGVYVCLYVCVYK